MQHVGPQKGASHKRNPLIRQLSQYWQAWQWYFLGAGWVVVILLGTTGYQQYHLELGLPQPFLNNLYQAIQLIVLESSGFSQTLPLNLQLARWLAPALAAYTAIQAAAIVFAEQFDRIRLRTMRDHVIICGLGRRGYLIAEGFLHQGENVVVIEKDAENDYLEPLRDLGGKALLGDAANPAMLALAGAARARYLVAVNGEDSTNAEIAVQARRLVEAAGSRNAPLKCLVHIDDPKLCDLLHDYEFSTSTSHKFRMEFFNVFDLGAQAVLAQYPPFTTEAVLEGGKTTHILVVGLGSMGRSLLVRAARAWRELQRKAGGGVPPLDITVIDRDAANKVETLKYRFPKLVSACSIQALQMDIRRQEFQRGDFLRGEQDEIIISVVYVCLDNDSLGLNAGLTLNQNLRDADVPIVIRTSNELGISSLWDGDAILEARQMSGSEEYKNLHAFGLLERTCQPDRLLGGTHETIARALHERIRRVSSLEGDESGSSQTWDRLDDRVRDERRRQADVIISLLRKSGYGIRQLVDWDAEIQPLNGQEVNRLLGEQGNTGIEVAFDQVPYVLAEAGMEVYRRENMRANEEG